MQILDGPGGAEQAFIKSNKISRKIWQKRYANFRFDRLWSKIPKSVVVRNFSGEGTWSWLNDRFNEFTVDELHTLLLYQFLVGVVKESYPDFYKAKLRFKRKHLGAAPKLPPKLERVTLAVMNNLDRELDYVLVSQLFSGFPKERVVKLVEKVQKSLIAQLENNDWLSVSGKKAAIHKIKHMRFSLVYPDKLKDWNMAPILDYDPHKPWTNVRRLLQVRMDQMLRELSQPVSFSRWERSPLEVGAYYDWTRNMMTVPLGILWPPFYDQSLPDVVNLGGIGMVIGHEMGHAIDNVGNHYDADGKYSAWMSDQDKRNFNSRSAKLVAQFNAIGHNGRATLGENIGDLVGLTAAYQAVEWDKMAAKSKDSAKNGFSLEEIDELKRQFFIRFARLWCTCERPGLTNYRLLVDPHALDWARVNQNVKQQPGFKEAFKCKAGDTMVLPKNELVKIW